MGGHGQTLAGHLLPQKPLISKGKRLDVALSDGDRLVAFVQEGDSPTVSYVFHGLAGSTDSTYMHRTSRLLQRLGHTVILVNHRGCGEGAGLAQRPYHSGRGEDLSAVIAAGRKLYPNKRHLAIGYSLSANALLLLMSGVRGQVKPDVAIAVNGPIDLARCSQALGQGFNRVYDLRFYIQCRHDVLHGLNADPMKYRFPRVAKLYEFDDIFTAPAGGFLNREEYYSTCSAGPHLAKIDRPTFILTAADDPFVTVESYRASQPSPSVRMHIEPSGGHMGYISKRNTPYGSTRWLDYAIDRAIACF